MAEKMSIDDWAMLDKYGRSPSQTKEQVLLNRIISRVEDFDIDDLKDCPIRQIVRLLINNGYLCVDSENVLKRPQKGE